MLHWLQRTSLALLTLALLGAAPGARAALSIPSNTWVKQPTPAQATLPGFSGTFQARGWRMDLIGVGERSGRARPGRALLGIRPECISLTGGDLGARVERVEHLGGDSLLHAGGPWGTVVVRIPSGARLPPAGAEMQLRPDPARAILFDPDSGERI